MPEHTTTTTQKRLRILGDDEIAALYGRPHFTEEERLEYFALAPRERAALAQLHSIKSRIYFLLQLGYFKSQHMFFVFDLPDVAEDARYAPRSSNHFNRIGPTSWRPRLPWPQEWVEEDVNARSCLTSEHNDSTTERDGRRV